MNKPGVVFLGTPEFAVASLDAIVKAGYEVRAVVTSPDKPAGRGLRMQISAVKEYALKNEIPVLQPLKLKDPLFLDTLKNLKADLQVIVAFRMLPEEVWRMPPLGTFNLHASLLPQYRGAAPINWAIINGETKTGVTTFFLNSEIDKGSIISSREVSIEEHENAGDIHDKLMTVGADLVIETIKNIINGTASVIEQEKTDPGQILKPAPKIFKNDCRISWEQDVKIIYNFIRGLSPYPAAWSELRKGQENPLSVKIFKSSYLIDGLNMSTGSIISDGKSYLRVAANNGFVSIERLQLQGKKEMTVAEFLRGFQSIEAFKFI